MIDLFTQMYTGVTVGLDIQTGPGGLDIRTKQGSQYLNKREK